MAARENPLETRDITVSSLWLLTRPWCEAHRFGRCYFRLRRRVNRFNFGAAPATAFANRDALITPLIDNMMGIAIQTQPDFVMVRDELGYTPAGGGHPGDLIDRLIAGGTDTRSIAKGACAAVLGSAVTLIQ